jgi:hypothetical protein
MRRAITYLSVGFVVGYIFALATDESMPTPQELGYTGR